MILYYILYWLCGLLGALFISRVYVHAGEEEGVTSLDVPFILIFSFFGFLGLAISCFFCLCCLFKVPEFNSKFLAFLNKRI